MLEWINDIGAECVLNECVNQKNIQCVLANELQNPIHHRNTDDILLAKDNGNHRCHCIV